MNGYLSYLTGGVFQPIYLPRPAGNRHAAVVLVHGLLHRSWAMVPLARYLQRQGYTAIVYDYRTTRFSIAEHGDRLRDYLCRIEAHLPADMVLHLIGHSMGGLLIRRALGDGALFAPARRGCCILLGVPHRGSPVAAAWRRRLPRLSGILVKPLAELGDRPGVPLALPEPAGWRTVSIVGRFDRKVPSWSSRYAPAEQEIEVDAGHDFLMNQPAVRREIDRLLRS